MDILNGLNDAQQPIIDFYLDEEERDLDKALHSIDVQALPTPDAETQTMLKEAAAHFAKQKERGNTPPRPSLKNLRSS